MTRGGNRTPESTARWVTSNRRAWLSELRSAFDGPFTTVQANELWCQDMAATRYRLRQLTQLGCLVVLSAVKHPKPLVWTYGFTGVNA